MPPGRKPQRSREQFVAAAIEMADAGGIAAVSTRALCAAVGASPTGVYRYFEGREDLLDAMRQELLTGLFAVLPADLQGREAIVAMSLGFRSQALAHPCLAEIMTLPAIGGEATGAVSTFTIASLRAMGVREDLLPRAYRQLETFVVGSMLFDYAGQPHHLEQRLHRVANTGDAALKARLRTAQDVSEDNEAAFAASLEAILDAITAESGRHRQRPTRHRRP